ncbi:hypothetical protein D3C85_685770 [compost metagenome]
MAYLELTSSAQIRSVLTVSPADLPDEVLTGYGLEDDLGQWLDKQLPTWETLTDAKHTRLLRLAAKYFCAGTVAKTAQVFALKKKTDGSNEGQRSDKDGFAWMAPALLANAQTAITDLLDDLDLLPEDATPLFISAARPTRDPITEPREDVS